MLRYKSNSKSDSLNPLVGTFSPTAILGTSILPLIVNSLVLTVFNSFASFTSGNSFISLESTFYLRSSIK